MKSRQLVESVYFDYIFGLILIANGVAIGAETDYVASSDVDTSTTGFKVLSVFFCVAFTVELSFRLCAYRRRLYTMRGWQWNYFDTFIVGVQILDEISALFFEGSAAQDVVKDIGIL